MSADIPSTYTGQVTPATSSQNVITKVPAGVSGLPEGSLLNAVVLRHDANGNPVLGTKGGEITISSRLVLTAGNSLVLKILPPVVPPSETSSKQSNSANKEVSGFRAQVVSVDGKPPQSPVQQQSQSQGGEKTPAPSGGKDMPAGYDIIKAVAPAPSKSSGPPSSAGTSQNVAQTDASVVRVSNGAQAEAVVITSSADSSKFLPRQPAAGQAASASVQNSGTPAAPLKAADTVTLHIISSNVPSASNPVATSTSQTPQAAGVSQVSAYQTNVSQSSETGRQPPPNSVTASSSEKPVQTQNSTQPVLNRATPVTNNQIFTGEVIGTEKSGEAVIKTSIGTLKLPAGINLPPGSRLELEVVKVQTQETRPSPQLSEYATQVEAAKFKIFGPNSVFAELASTLAAIDTEIGGSILSKTLPTADKQAAAKVLWFLAAVSSGDAKKWLGQKVSDQLQQYNKGDLLARLDTAFASLKAVFSETSSSGWQTFLFPVYDGSKLQNGQFYVHRDGKKKGKQGDSDDDVRFLVELYLDTMGEIQMDGFVKDTSDSKRLDLFIRTKDPLPDEMHNDIIDIFSDTIEIQGIKGEVQFHVAREFPRPYDEKDENSPDGGIIA